MLSSRPWLQSGPTPMHAVKAAVRRGSSREATSQIELAVAHFCFNQAVGFANVLPEVPSPKTSLFALCVESSFNECISIEVSLVDFVKIIKCHSSFAVKSRSP